MKMRSFPNTRRVPARAHGGHQRSARKTGHGFALIEALVSLLLFSLGILGLIGLQARAISIADDAEDRNRAALIADQCASAMQLQANSVPLASVSTLATICQTPAWSDFVSNPARGGLPNGTITVGASAVDSSASTPSIVPVGIDIKVTWEPPARANANGSINPAAASQLTTRVTLLLRNG